MLSFSPNSHQVSCINLPHPVVRLGRTLGSALPSDYSKEGKKSGRVDPVGAVRSPSVSRRKARARLMTGQEAETDLLLPRIAEGDADAVEACLDRFGGLVWSLARRMCRDGHEAEDAVQDIFVEVWKNAGRYDSSVASEATFIAMIARRRLIDRRRRDSRRPKEAALTEEMFSGASAHGSGDPAGSFGKQLGARPGGMSGEDVEAARQVLSELSEDQQRVLQLSIFYGLSHEKISESTGLPLGTVKTHARRGLIKVREMLADSGMLLEDPPGDNGGAP